MMIALLSCMTTTFAATIDVRIRIMQRNADEKIITRENLIRIQQFIFKQGKRETYSNMYGNNPAYHTTSYKFYLNPDSLDNIDCDITKSEFHNMTIRKSDGGMNQYRNVEFLKERDIYITVSWPSEDLDVREIRTFAEEAITELLAAIEENEQSEPDEHDEE